MLLQFAIESRYRQTGRTTRLIDKYIQELFNRNGEWVTITDHTDLPIENEYKLRMAKQLFDKIILRLKFEHNYKRNNNLSIESRIDNDNNFQAKLTYSSPKKEYVESLFKELYKRILC